jgi:hypothetical protein
MAKLISASAKCTEILGQLDPLSISFTYAVLRCRPFVDSSPSALPLRRFGLIHLFISFHMSIFLRFYHNHSVRGLESGNREDFLVTFP